MRRTMGDEKLHIILLVAGSFFIAPLLAASSQGTALNIHRGAQSSRAALDSQHYDIGTPILKDLFISPTGNNNSNGTSREQPLRTLSAAWSRVPQGDLQTTGY